MTHRTDCASLIDRGVRPCTCAGATPPPDAQAMTRDKRVLTSEEYVKALIGLAGSPLDAECDPDCFILAEHFRGQAETIRQLEVELKKWRDSFAGHVYVKNEEWSAKCEEVRSLQARLTASEAARKWTTGKPKVAGWYWWRHDVSKKPVPLLVSANHVEGLDVFTMGGGVFRLEEIPGEFQGPLTPGEE